MKLAMSSGSCCVPGRAVKDGSSVSVQPGVSSNLSAHQNLHQLPGGWYFMGTNSPHYPEDGESPRRSVFVDEFSLSPVAVSNEAFDHFIGATGYLTTAEQLGRSFVFCRLLESTQGYKVVPHTPWWTDVPGACWKAPHGPGSSIDDIPNHPVTHVSYTDALHYCRWAGVQLPTEAQWEFAARSGLADQPFPWGDELEQDQQHRCNVWQGSFPLENSAADGYIATAPVTAFQPNHFGMYNMTGNIWEWVADRFTHNHSPRPVKNPCGPLNGDRFVTRGGSYLCHHSYCSRFHVYSRQGLSADSTAGNVGFRVAGIA